MNRIFSIFRSKKKDKEEKAIPEVQEANTVAGKIRKPPKTAAKARKANKSKMFSFRIEESLLEEFQLAAQKNNTTASALIRKYIKDYCKKNQ